MNNKNKKKTQSLGFRWHKTLEPLEKDPISRA